MELNNLQLWKKFKTDMSVFKGINKISGINEISGTFVMRVVDSSKYDPIHDEIVSDVLEPSKVMANNLEKGIALVKKMPGVPSFGGDSIVNEEIYGVVPEKGD